MEIVLIPGFWLTGDSWNEVTGALTAAGHHVHPLTLPGKEASPASHAGIGLQTHIDAVTARVEQLAAQNGPVVLVGHSGGAAIAWGVADARPELIDRLIFVDALPFGDGSVVNDELPTDGDSVPLPAWEVFDDEDLTDLTPELREKFRQIAVPEPRGVAQDPLRLSNDDRYRIPATVIACEFPASMVEDAIERGAGWAGELARLGSLTVVELPTGHWPQLTRPGELGQSILAAIEAR